MADTIQPDLSGIIGTLLSQPAAIANIVAILKSAGILPARAEATEFTEKTGTASQGEALQTGESISPEEPYREDRRDAAEAFAGFQNRPPFPPGKHGGRPGPSQQPNYSEDIFSPKQPDCQEKPFCPKQPDCPEKPFCPKQPDCPEKPFCPKQPDCPPEAPFPKEWSCSPGEPPCRKDSDCQQKPSRPKPGPKEREKLLCAMKPFLSVEKAKKLDEIMKVTELITLLRKKGGKS